MSQTGLTLENLDAIAPTALTITGAANNGSGLIRLTLSAESNSNFTILGQNTIEVYGVTGTTEANGNWKFTVVDATHIDLVGSTFTNAYVSGGQIGGSLDAMTLSLDAYATAVQPEIAQVSGAHVLGFFRAPIWKRRWKAPSKARTRTASPSAAFVPSPSGNALRLRLLSRYTVRVGDPGAEVPVNARTGRCDVRRDTRYSRFKVRIPAERTGRSAPGRARSHN